MVVKTVSLASAPAGGNYTITALPCVHENHLRLMELGFQAGEPVAVLQRAPFHGLIKVKIKETRFAIAHADANAIMVAAL